MFLRSYSLRRFVSRKTNLLLITRSFFSLNSLTPPGANYPEPDARIARVVRTGLSQIGGLGLPVLTLLSHGEPHVKEIAYPKTKKKGHPLGDSFFILEAWR